MKRPLKEIREEFDNMGLRDCVEMFLARHPDSPRHLTYAEMREQILFAPDAIPPRPGADCGTIEHGAGSPSVSSR